MKALLPSPRADHQRAWEPGVSGTPPDPPRQNLHVNGDAVATTGVCSTAHLTEGLVSQRLTGGLPADEVNP